MTEAPTPSTDGGPAFPRQTYDYYPSLNKTHAGSSDPGMSLRDWYAGQVIATLLGGSILSMTLPSAERLDAVARDAFTVADAMIRQRSRQTVTEETKATPGPWEVCREPPNPLWHKGTTIFSPDEGKRIADTCVLDDRAEANAELIVRAVNAHAGLVKALEPFAAIAEWADQPIKRAQMPDDLEIYTWSMMVGGEIKQISIKWGDVRRARAALSAKAPQSTSTDKETGK